MRGLQEKALHRQKPFRPHVAAGPFRARAGSAGRTRHRGTARTLQRYLRGTHTDGASPHLMPSKLNLCRPRPPAPPLEGAERSPTSHREGDDRNIAVALLRLRYPSRPKQKLGARLSPSGHASLGSTLAAAQEMRRR